MKKITTSKPENTISISKVEETDIILIKKCYLVKMVGLYDSHYDMWCVAHPGHGIPFKKHESIRHIIESYTEDYKFFVNDKQIVPEDKDTISIGDIKESDFIAIKNNEKTIGVLICVKGEWTLYSHIYGVKMANRSEEDTPTFTEVGKYRSLSECIIVFGEFDFYLL